MNVLQVLDLGLAAMVLAVAGWTIFARAAFAAIVGYVAYGLLVSIVWVRLFAPDVAMTEAAVGSGVTGILLISAAVRLRDAERAAAAEQSSVTLRSMRGHSLPRRDRGARGRRFAVARSRPDAGSAGGRAACRDRARQSRHGGSDGLSLFRHHA